MDLHFNERAEFTRWVVRSGLLAEPCVVIDVGVQGGENPRWHLLEDHLVLHGFDAIEEIVVELQQRNAGNPNRHYHAVGVGNQDEEREFYFNAADSTSSSFYQQGDDRFDFLSRRSDQTRTVKICRLDTLLREGVIKPPDFLKIDVEGFEKEVILGADETLGSVLGVECETSLGISPTYPQGHFCTVQAGLLPHKLLAFDLGFNRLPRASFQQGLAKKGLPPITDQQSVGKPATFNVLFCRNAIDEVDVSQNYVTPYRPLGLDQLIKLMIVYELHGLNDIAVDTAVRFADQLGGRLDVEQAIDLLIDPGCLGAAAVLAKVQELQTTNADLLAQLGAIRNSRSWRLTSPLRAIRNLFG